MRSVRIYILFVDGVFKDVFASYSAASLAASIYPPASTRIEYRDRDEY
jgi:hypothetical protein